MSLEVKLVKINFIEQLTLIFLVYLTISFLISIPFYLSNFKVSFLSAYFESISGLTEQDFQYSKILDI